MYRVSLLKVYMSMCEFVGLSYKLIFLFAFATCLHLGRFSCVAVAEWTSRCLLDVEAVRLFL